MKVPILLITLVWIAQMGWTQIAPQTLLASPNLPWQAGQIYFSLLAVAPWWLLARTLRERPAWPLLAGLALTLWATPLALLCQPAHFLFVLCSLQTPLRGLAWLALLWLQPVAGLAWLWAELGRRRSSWAWFTLPLFLALPPLQPDFQAITLAALACWWTRKDAQLKPLSLAQLALLVGSGQGLPWHLLWLALSLPYSLPRTLWMGLSLLFFLGWETRLNRCLILPLQENRLPLRHLLLPSSLETWTVTAGQRLGMSASDLELADWLRQQPLTLKVAVHRLEPQPRLQPRLPLQVLQRLSGHILESGWIADSLAENLKYPFSNLDLLVIRGAVPPTLDLQPVAQGKDWSAYRWQPLPPLTSQPELQVEVKPGPGSSLRIDAPDTVEVSDGHLKLRLEPGSSLFRIPLEGGMLRVFQGDLLKAEARSDLSKALANLKVVGFEPHPEMASNSLLQIPLGLRLEGQQALEIPYLGVQLSRPELEPGWRQNSPITPVFQVIQPAQEVSIPTWIETPEEGKAFGCDIYWLAPGIGEKRIGELLFTCYKRHPPRNLEE